MGGADSAPLACPSNGNDMNELAYTRHAERRAQQRGIALALIDTVLRHADIEMPVGGRCVALRLSVEGIRLLRRECGAARADRAKDIVLILADGVLVTAMRAIGAAGRHYRMRRR